MKEEEETSPHLSLGDLESIIRNIICLLETKIIANSITKE
jgi:hypothetical protein